MDNERENIVVDVYGVFRNYFEGKDLLLMLYTVEGDREVIFHEIDWDEEAKIMGVDAIRLDNVRGVG